MDQNKLAIHINGTRYAIKTPEDPAYVAGLAHEIDTAVRNIIQAGPSMGEAMVILCLAYLDNWKKAEHSVDNLRTQLTQYMDDATKARSEAGELRRELEKLQRRQGGRQSSPNSQNGDKQG